MGLLWEVGIADFIIVTLLLGGGAAYMTGRAVANAWEPVLKAIVWVALLTAAVRFIHFAMFNGTLLSAQYYLADLIILSLAAVLGHKITRFRQMTRRYGWVIKRDGFLNWRLRD